MFSYAVTIFCMSCTHLMGQISIIDYAKIVGEVDPSTCRIHTLNNNGSAMCFSTELTEAFLEQCRDPACTYVLEVGCAYGIKSSQIVQTGVFLVANDLDPAHLEIMKDRFTRLSVADPMFNNVRYVMGNFATLGEEELGKRKYDAILCESVLHFMLPEEFRKTLNTCNSILNIGGKIYITALSPFIQPLRETFVANQAKGLEWPGIFEDPAKISPVIYNVVDEDMLRRELKLAGFNVLMSKYIPKFLLEKEYHHDGRDWLIVIAEKIPYRKEGLEMIRRFVILRCKPGMSVQEFRRYWKTVHGPLIGKIPGVIRYTQYHVRSPDGVEDPIDGIAELWFYSEEEQKKAYSTEEYQAVIRDEPNLFAMDTHHIHPVMTDEIVQLV